MKTITIQHPLRLISYKSKHDRYFMDSERRDLLAYRRAHDEAWRMKIHFQQVQGEVLLTQHELDDMTYDRQELEEMWDYYRDQVDFNHPELIFQVEMRFQVELRDFYLQVRGLQQKSIRFYDKVAALEIDYKVIIDSYYRGKKPLDPLDFHILDDIFTFASDRETDIVSLDEDLQAFLQELGAIYTDLDNYIASYSAFYTQYQQQLQKVAELLQTIKPLDRIWSDPTPHSPNSP